MKVELTINGQTAKEIITNFFASSDSITREEAEMLYSECESIGQQGGTQFFDEAVITVCESLNLDHKQLQSKFQK